MELRGDLPGGRRELRIRVGPISVAVTEIPGKSLTDRELQHVLTARRSYAHMWGGDGNDIVEDEFDGRQSSLYDTRHYLAWARDDHGQCKLLTMRKILMVPSQLSRRQRSDPFDVLPFDLKVWRTFGEDGVRGRLWDVLRAHARSMAPYDPHAEFRIATLSRVATSPCGTRRRTTLERDRTAIAFAAIQLLATYADPSLLYVWSLRHGFPEKVLQLEDRHGYPVVLDCSLTESVLGLPAGSVHLDNRLRMVREHKAAYPGYFVDNHDAGRVVASLLDEGRISVTDLAATIMRVIEHESARGACGHQLAELVDLAGDRDHRRLACALTQPRLFKHLTPLMRSCKPLARVVNETGDGAFSSTLIPWRWSASAWSVLEAAEMKYGVVAERDQHPRLRVLSGSTPSPSAA